MRNACTHLQPTNQLGTGALAPETEAWLAGQRAVFARLDADGVIEFSRRPVSEAWTDAARDLLLSGATASSAVPVLDLALAFSVE